MVEDTGKIVNIMLAAISFDDLDSLIRTLEMMLSESRKLRREIKRLH